MDTRNQTVPSRTLRVNVPSDSVRVQGVRSDGPSPAAQTITASTGSECGPSTLPESRTESAEPLVAYRPISSSKQLGIDSHDNARYIPLTHLQRVKRAALVHIPALRVDRERDESEPEEVLPSDGVDSEGSIVGGDRGDRGPTRQGCKPESTDRSVTGRAAGLPGCWRVRRAGPALPGGAGAGRSEERSLGGAEGAVARVRKACAGMLARGSDPGRRCERASGRER